MTSGYAGDHLIMMASNIVNIGVGEDVSIKELAESVKKAVGYKGELNLILQSQMVLQENY